MNENNTWRNEYYRSGQLVKIVMTYKKYIEKPVHYTIIDYDDFDKLKNTIWSTIHDKRKPDYMVYVISTTNNKLRAMHRIIMNPPKGMVIDHINRNPLDNRRCNLRICTIAENNRNLSIRKNNTSGIMGVYYKPDKKHKPWVGQKYYKGTWLPIKLFATKEEAIAYRKHLDETYK